MLDFNLSQEREDNDFFIEASVVYENDDTFINFTIYFKNKSCNDLKKVFLGIPVPEHTDLCRGSIYINTEKSSDDFLGGIGIKIMPPNNTLLLQYRVVLNKNIDTLANLASISYQTINGVEKVELSNTVKVDIINQIQELKEVHDNDFNSNSIVVSFCNDRKEIIKDSENEYKITIENLGDMIFEDCIITIEVIDGTEINNESIVINNEHVNEENIRFSRTSLKIYIGNIKGNSEYCIKYLANCRNVQKGILEMVSMSKLSGYFICEEEKVYRDYFCENIENIMEASLRLFVDADKKSIVKDEIITYKGTIINDGTVPLKVKYFMKVSNGLCIDKSEVKINEEICYVGQSGEKAIVIKLVPGDGANIEYKYKYVRSYGNNKVFAEAIAEYEYEIKDMMHESNIIKSNKISTEAAITAFKEFSVEEVLEFKKIKVNLNDVVTIDSEVAIEECHVIQNKRNNFIQSWIIGKTIMVSGVLKLIVEYTSNSNRELINLYCTNKIFSTSINLPEDYVDGELDNIDVEIQDVYYKVVDNEKLFISTNILIKTTI